MNISVEQIEKALAENKYILLSHHSGILIGVNARIVKTSNYIFNRTFKSPKQKTAFIGFLPCDLHSYISNKIPFIS